MKCQSKTIVQVSLSQDDIRLALAQYISAHGLSIEAEDIPKHIDLNDAEVVITVESVEGIAPPKPAPKQTTTKKATAKPSAVVETQEVKPAEVVPEPAETFQPESMINNEDEQQDEDEDEDELVEEFVPTTKGDSSIFEEDTADKKVEGNSKSSIFDDEEPAITPSTKISAGIFDE